ncbi:MAG: hypothetical protein GX813_05025 [Erysipelotrichia bacterium]|nr:hypothetical protein [Erysipelotrichia bacterium]
MKNTPAPWSIRKQGIGDGSCVVPVEIIGADGFTIISNKGGLSPNEPWKAETLEANANLIAAAPEMYQALDEMYEYMSDHFKGHNFRPMLARAAFALAKAKGSQV